MHKQLYIYAELPIQIHIQKNKNKTFICRHNALTIKSKKKKPGVLNDRCTLFEKKTGHFIHSTSDLALTVTLMQNIPPPFGKRHENDNNTVFWFHQ